MAKSKIINVRINDELQNKLDKLICDMQKELPRGAEVNISSLIRGALEILIEDYYKPYSIVTSKLDTSIASLGELKAMQELKLNEEAKLMAKELDLAIEGIEYDTTTSKRKHDKLKQDLDLISSIIKIREEKKGE